MNDPMPLFAGLSWLLFLMAAISGWDRDIALSSVVGLVTIAICAVVVRGWVRGEDE